MCNTYNSIKIHNWQNIMNYKPIHLIICLCSLLCLQVTARAEDDAPALSPTLQLTVKDSILMALENNRSLAVEKYAPEIASTFVAEEQSVFDSSLDAGFTFTDSDGQRSSGVGEFHSVTSRQYNAAGGISKRLPIGLEMGFGLSTTERESNVYTRMFSSRLGADIIMPALKGFGKDVNLIGIHLAEKEVELSKYELKGFLLTLTAEVEENYWNLLSAKEELRIHNTSLELAGKQLQETKDRIDVGKLAEIDMAAAEGEVALRETSVIDAQSAIQKASLRLLQSINPPQRNFWDLDVELLNPPEIDDFDAGTINNHIAVALATRPDLFQARIEIERNDIQLVRTKNGLLPKLDFFITLGKTGYSDAFNDSFSNITEDNYDARTGFTFSMPLGNRAAKARHARVIQSKKKNQIAYDNFKQLVELDVRVACAELTRAKRQISATQRATQLQEAKYQAELEKFRVGKSTNLLVLTTQRDLIASQLDEIDAQINLRKAILGLYLAEGTLLDHYTIVLPSK